MNPFPRRARGGTFVRFFLAALLVVGLTAGATATAGLLQVKNFVNDLDRGQTIKGPLRQVLTEADYGKAQTLLLIGSDHRFATGSDARSDTMLLVRLDPKANAISVLSMPRDLMVSYTYRGVTHTGVKLNETYTDGGEALVAREIKSLLPGVQINHIINVNFGGFSAAVNAIGCVYADIDHFYYHSNLGLPAVDQYSEINIPPGYQRLCGERALEYVRYRHGDTDFVRAARQQDFLRQLRTQYGVSDFVNDPHKITRIIGRYSTTDPNLHSTDALLKLANLAIFTANKSIRQIQFPPAYENLPSGSFVVASTATLQRVRDQFLNPRPPAPPKPPKPARKHGRGRGAKAPSGPTAASLGLIDVTQTGMEYATGLGAMNFPIYYPSLLTSGSEFEPTSESPQPGGYPRAYRIKAPDGRMHQAYRLVIHTTSQGNDVYYGVEGTTWTNPPILNDPSSDRRVVNGKHLLLFYDGTKLHTVAWRHGNAVYWVQNTLQDVLTNDQMLQIAGSLTQVGGGHKS